MTDTRPVLHAVQELSDALDRMFAGMREDMDMRPTDLSALRMLAIRERRAEEVTPQSLARHLGITTASATALLDRLTQQGHVDRVVHPDDRRSRLVTLTPHARETFFAHFWPRISIMNTVAERYDDAELAVITDFMHQLADAVARPTDGEPHAAPAR